MKKSAAISTCKKYRYYLSRQWDEGSGTCVFIMLNPSKADAEIDDPTVRRGIGFSKDLGCKKYVAVNIWGYRATDPRELFKADRPFGEDNKRYILSACEEVRSEGGFIVCAWGQHGERSKQGERMWLELMHLGFDLYCLKLLMSGHPGHPLYLPKKSKLIKYEYNL